ncbi:dioxygenase [Streptomyces capparidis]
MREEHGTPDDGGAAEGAPDRPGGISRKGLLKAALVAAPLPLVVGAAPPVARGAAEGGGPAAPPALTPSCDDGDGPTHPQIEGPYFKPDSPERVSLLEPGAQGTRLTVSGYVFGLACRPLSRVLLDFWQADANGAYDNAGYRLRGHQFTDARGAYRLTTIVPGLYPGRTRHLHVKAQAPGRPVLTTQLYFPGEPRNSTDALFDPALLMTVRTAGSGLEAVFDFVLDVPQTPDDPPGGTWRPGTVYAAGAVVTYAGRGYRCLQSHTAAVGWEPPNIPALWRAV